MSLLRLVICLSSREVATITYSQASLLFDTLGDASTIREVVSSVERDDTTAEEQRVSMSIAKGNDRDRARRIRYGFNVHIRHYNNSYPSGR